MGQTSSSLCRCCGCKRLSGDAENIVLNPLAVTPVGSGIDDGKIYGVYVYDLCERSNIYVLYILTSTLYL